MTLSPVTAAPAWFVVPHPLSHPRLRLVCLAHAGAGASSFFPWSAPLRAADVEVRAVQYPGREHRLDEPLIDSVPAMIAALADAWPALSGGGPCALFGHSMGALLAYELALELERRQSAHRPRRLFLSGRNPPEAPRRLPPIHRLPDDAFLREVAARYGNMPPQVLQNRELVALLTPILRADFTLVETYAGTPPSALATPFTILGGTEDPWTSPAELRGWQSHTRGDCRLRLLDGDHFFPQRRRPEVLAAIQADGLAGALDFP